MEELIMLEKQYIFNKKYICIMYLIIEFNHRKLELPRTLG